MDATHSPDPRVKMKIPPLRFFIASPLIGLWLIFTCLWGFILCIVRWRDPRIPGFMVRFFSPVCLWLSNIQIKYTGWHNVPEERSAVYVANHQSGALDLAVFGHKVPSKMVVVAKEELKRIPVFGQFWYAAGNLYIQRADRKGSVQVLNSAQQQLKDGKLSVFVFVEGTRNKTRPGELLPFKKGAFHMAIGAQVPIVPVVCSNLWEVCDPLGDEPHWRGGEVVVEHLEPIETKGMTVADVDSLLELTRNKMAKTLEKMNRRGRLLEREAKKTK